LVLSGGPLRLADGFYRRTASSSERFLLAVGAAQIHAQPSHKGHINPRFLISQSKI
jgi:hypothetical protein